MSKENENATPAEPTMKERAARAVGSVRGFIARHPLAVSGGCLGGGAIAGYGASRYQASRTEA